MENQLHINTVMVKCLPECLADMTLPQLTTGAIDKLFIELSSYLMEYWLLQFG